MIDNRRPKHDSTTRGSSTTINYTAQPRPTTHESDNPQPIRPTAYPPRPENSQPRPRTYDPRPTTQKLMTHDPQDIRRPTKTTHDTRPSSPSAEKTDYNTPCVFGVTPTQGPTPHPLSYYYMPQRVNWWAHGRVLVVLGSARDPRTILEPPSGPPLNPSGPNPGPRRAHPRTTPNQRNLAKLEVGASSCGRKVPET